MTYCVALKLDQGLVFLADTRTNAGVDTVSRVRKLFTWSVPGERAIALMTAGNLGMTQAVISELEEQIEHGDEGEENLLNAPSMLAAARLVGQTMYGVQQQYSAGLTARGEDPSATLILGGQRRGGVQRLFLIYSAGNFIEAWDDTPYFQIGEHKYGKPIIDRVISVDTDLQDGVLCALLSMDSTIRSNLTVGMPLDMAVLPTETFAFINHRRIERDDPAFLRLSEQWSRQLIEAFAVMRLDAL